MASPTVSIVTPSFNQAPFLAATIESVLSQEGDFRIDYIIMDGGSTDDSPAIIRKYDDLLARGAWRARCQGIRYRFVSKRDDGQVDGIEKGFAIADGDIAAWLNSDDVYCGAGMLDRVVREFASDDELQMLTADGLFIDREGCEFGIHHVDRIDFDELLFLDYHILQPATFLRADVIARERLDRSYNSCFDAEYFIRLMRKGYRRRKIDDKLACFRLYPETKTLSGLRRRYRESLRIARRHSWNPFRHAVSSFYKYFEIVLQNEYADVALIKAATQRIMRPLAYQLILRKPAR